MRWERVMDEKKCINAGTKVSDFTIKDQNERDFKLSNFKGKKILLSFHPLAWTSVCAKQMQSLEENQNKFKELNTVAVGISIDTIPSKKAWAQHLGIKNTRLLCDFWPHGKVIKEFGIFRDNDGFSERANIILDENQTVEYVQIYELPQLPDIEEIINVLTTLQE
jgi:peroxiredoxin